MTIMSKALSAIGLMRVSEHEAAVSDRVSIAFHNDVVNAFKEQLANKEAKFKKAVADLAAASDEIAGLKDDVRAAEVSADIQRARAKPCAQSVTGEQS